MSPGRSAFQDPPCRPRYGLHGAPAAQNLVDLIREPRRIAKLKADAQLARPSAQEVIEHFQIDGKCRRQLEKGQPEPVCLAERNQRCLELADPIFSITQPVPVKMSDRLRPAFLRLCRPALGHAPLDGVTLTSTELK
jgi:hypothetical protein